MGSDTNTRLEPFTEVNHKFAEIDEGFRNFTESMLLQGWDLKNGALIKSDQLLSPVSLAKENQSTNNASCRNDINHTRIKKWKN